MLVRDAGSSALRIQWAIIYKGKKGRGKDCLLQVDIDAELRHASLAPPSLAPP